MPRIASSEIAAPIVRGGERYENTTVDFPVDGGVSTR